jgi:nucleotide-binding universal stress UspA family protein
MGLIVVGHDGSSSGDAALDMAIELAEGLGDEIAIVFGYAPPGLWGGEIVEHEEAISEYGEKVVAAAKQRAASRGVEVETLLIPKKASEALLSVAEERDARMIVVGSYGDPPLKGAILGSTPNKLLHIADRPILVVPGSQT